MDSGCGRRGSLRPGLIASLQDLKSRNDLNGQRILVLRFSERNERWGVFVVATADQIAVQPKNIDVSAVHDSSVDWLLSQVVEGDLGGLHKCHEFTRALVTALSKCHSNLAPQHPVADFDDFARCKLLAHPSKGGIEAGHYVIIVALNAAAHEFAFEIFKHVKTSDDQAGDGHTSVRGRVFQSWIRDGCSGYTAREFATGAKGVESFRWMESNSEVMQFFSDVQKVRSIWICFPQQLWVGSPFPLPCECQSRVVQK